MNVTATEMMICAASRELRDHDSVLVGVGVPNLACNLAKRTHAPNLTMIYESGTIDSNPDRLPLSIGDPVLSSTAVNIESMFDGFSYYLQAGHIDVGFLGGAQIDKRGNINSTVIGEYDDPKVRLPGSGGACEIAINAGKTIILAPHRKRRFPESVDFVTSPGYLRDAGDRERLGIGGGPEAVITDLGVMRFDETGEMYVDSIHPETTRESIQNETAWDIAFADELRSTPEPDEETVRLIREDLDPKGMYTE